MSLVLLKSGLEQYGNLVMCPAGVRTHCIFFGICNFLLVISRLGYEGVLSL